MLKAKLSPWRRLAALAGIAGACSLVTPTAFAVGTRSFQLETLDDLAAGDLTGVAVDSHGNVRAGWELGKIPVNDATTAWSSALLPDGTILVGTGNEGKIMKVANGQVSLGATTGEMAVSSMVTAWNGDVIAGSFPHGKLFRLPKGEAKGGEIKAWTTLEGGDYVWALAFDEKSKSLYAATGPEGKILRVDDAGKAQVFYKSDDNHIVSLAVGPDGTVYAGTSGKALLLAINGPGRARVVYDFDAEDVKAVAVAKDGTIWAAANKYGGSFSLPSKSGGGVATPVSSRPSKGGEGVLYRFKNGNSEEMINDKKSHYETIALDDAGVPYVGTGSEGRVYTVDDDHLVRVVAHTDSRQIPSLVVSGKKKYLIGSDPIVEHDIKGEGGAEAVWTSKVLDAGIQATFGDLKWRGAGGVQLSTRSGQTLEPDSSWSPWSADMAAPGKAKLPAGRYVQIRARFGKDATATLSEVQLSFLTDNMRAIVTSISAESRLQKKSGTGAGIVSSGGKAPKPSATISLKWDVENPDKDDLRYRVYYRLDGQTEWRDATKPGEILTSSNLEWDTSALPEGNYRIKVEASDELVNPPERVMKHSLESSTILVDNTPPVFKTLALNGRKLTGTVTDGLGPISRIEISVAGTDDWRPIFPKDLVFDDASEDIDSDVSSIVPPGNHLVAVRAFDGAGNSVVKELEAK